MSDPTDLNGRPGVCTPRMGKWLPLSLLAASLGVTGCSAVSDDVASELRQMTAGVQGRVEPLPVFKAYTPVTYTVANLSDPFGPAKAQLAAIEPEVSTVKPDLNRPREALEAFPLDALTFVGTIVRRGKTFALIENADALYEVKAGNYLGQNFGRISAIAEQEILIEERIQEPSGKWAERQSRLTLVPK